MKLLEYKEGTYYSDGDPVSIYYQEKSHFVFPKVWVMINHNLMVWNPGILLIAKSNCSSSGDNSQRTPIKIGRDEHIISCRDQHLLKFVIGNESGPPTLRHPPKGEEYRRLMYTEFQYKVISEDSFIASPEEDLLFSSARACLEEVLNDGDWFVAQLFGPVNIVHISGGLASLVKSALNQGVLVGVSYARQTAQRVCREVYSGMESLEDPVKRKLKEFERIFDEEEWPRYAKERLDEMKRSPQIFEADARVVN